MNTAVEHINSAGHIFVEFALPMLIQSSVLIVILLLVDLLLRKKVKAVFRYWIWMLVLLKLVLPTSLSSPLSLGYLFGEKLTYEDLAQSSPTLEPAVPVPADISPGMDPLFIQPNPYIPPPEPVISFVEPAIAGPVSPPDVPVTPLSWQGVVFLVWLAVVIAMGLLLLQRALFVRGLVAQAKKAGRLMNDALAYCCASMGIKSKVRLKVSVNATTPSVCGLIRPVILVPWNLTSTLGASRMRTILMHELAHIRRCDLWVNLAQTALQIIYFYNPLLWLANCVIRRIREQAVDEAVLVAMGEKARKYPQTLVDVAKMAFKRPALSLRLIGVVESRSALAGRIKHILGRPIPKTARLGLISILAIIIAGAVLLPMAKAKENQKLLKGIDEKLKVTDKAGDLTINSLYMPSPNGKSFIGTNKVTMYVDVTNNSKKDIYLGLEYYTDSGTIAKVFSPGATGRARIKKVPAYWQGKLEYPIHYSRFVKGGYVKITLARCAGKQNMKEKKLAFLPPEVEIIHEKKYDIVPIDDTQPDAGALTGSSFTTTLPNGVTVELVGVCEHPSEGKKWWRPDGRLLGQSPVRNIDVGGYNIRRGEAAYELVAKLTGPETLLSRSSTPEKWKVSQARKVGLGKSGTAKDKSGKSCLRATTAIVKNGLEKIDIEFGLAGVWEKRLTISSNESSKQKIRDTGVVINPPYEKDSNATVTIKIPNKIDSKMAINISAVLKNGKVIGHASWNRNSKFRFMRSTDNYEFYGINLSDVDHFEIYTSKYQWVEFKDVSLEPNFKTDVQIEVESEKISGVVGIQDSTLGKSTSAEAAFIIQKVLDRYAAIKTYSAIGELLTDVDRPLGAMGAMPGMTTEMLQQMGEQQLKSIFTIKMARPNLYCIEWNENIDTDLSKAGNAWSVGDGSYGLILGKEKSFEKPLRALIWTANNMGRVQSSLFFDTSLNTLRELRDLSQQEDEQPEGVDCYVISGSRHRTTYTYWVSKKDFLIRRYKFVSGGDGKPIEGGGHELTDETIKVSLKAMDKEATPEEIAKTRAMLTAAIAMASEVKVTNTETYRNIILDQPISKEQFVPSKDIDEITEELKNLRAKYIHRLKNISPTDPNFKTDVEVEGDDANPGFKALHITSHNDGLRIESSDAQSVIVLENGKVSQVSSDGSDWFQATRLQLKLNPVTIDLDGQRNRVHVSGLDCSAEITPQNGLIEVKWTDGKQTNIQKGGSLKILLPDFQITVYDKAGRRQSLLKPRKRKGLISADAVQTDVLVGTEKPVAGEWEDIGNPIPADFNDTIALTEQITLRSIGQDVEGKSFITFVWDKEKNRNRQYRFVLIKNNGTILKPDSHLILDENGRLEEKFTFDEPHVSWRLKEFKLQSRPPPLAGNRSISSKLQKGTSGAFEGKTISPSKLAPPGRYAIELDGIDDYLLVPDSPTLRLKPPFTVEMWIKPKLPEQKLDRLQQWGVIAQGGYVGTGRAKPRGFGIELTRFEKELATFQISYTEANDGGLFGKDYGNYLFDEWMHISHVFEGENYNPGHGHPLVVGRFLIPSAEPFMGQIGEIRIWNTARTRQEIRRYKNAALTGKEPGLAACWTFEQNEGQFAYDISGNNNHGRLGKTIEADDADPKWVDLEAASRKPDRIADVQDEAEGAEASSGESEPAANEDGPGITFESLVCDLGQVPPRTKHSCKFKFTNTGSDVLKITKVSSTCGCITSKLKKKEYAPGESETLEATYQSSASTGRVKKYVFVYSNDKVNPRVILAVKAEIVIKVAHEPKKLNLLLDKKNAGCPAVTLTSLDNQPFSITGFKSTGDSITADFDPSVKETSFVLKPKVDMEKLAKGLRGNIEIGLTHPECKKITILYDTLSEFKTNPRVIYVREAEPLRPVTKTVSVLSNYNEDFEIESTSSKKDTIKVLAQEKVRNGYQFELQITPPAVESKRRVFTDVFTVVLKGGQKLKVTCYGIYSKKPAETLEESVSKNDAQVENEQSDEASEAANAELTVPGPVETRGRISGVVVNSATGEPITGAYVGVGDFGDSGGSNYSRHREKGFHDKTKTDAEGRFELGGLAFTDKHRDLEYHPLVVTHPDFVRHDEEIELLSSGPVPDVKISLRPAAKIDVTIVDAQGNPLEGQWLIRLEALDGRRFIPPGSDPHLSSFASSIWIERPKPVPAKKSLSGTTGFSFTELDRGQYSIDVIEFAITDNYTPPPPGMVRLPLDTSKVSYYGGMANVKIEAGRTKEVRIKPAEYQTSVSINMPQDPIKKQQIPPFVIISRNTGLLMWNDGKAHGPEDHRLGRIQKNALYYNLVVEADVFTIENLPPGSYSVFAGPIYFMSATRMEVSRGREVVVDMPPIQITEHAKVGLWTFDRKVKPEARDYSVSELCELLTAMTESNPRIIADSSIENEKLRFGKGEMSIWGVLEKLYLDKGWRVEEGQEKTLVLKLGTKTDVQVEGGSKVSRLLTAFQNEKYVYIREPIIQMVKEIGDKEPISFLTEQLKSENRRRRCYAAFALELVGDKRGVPAIIKELEDTSYRPTTYIRSDGSEYQEGQVKSDRVCAASVLGLLGDKRAVPALIKAIKDDSIDWCVAQSLGQIGDKRAVPALRDTLDKNLNKPFQRVFTGYGLAMLGDEEGLEVVIDTLNNRQVQWDVRRYAIDLLGKLGDKQAVPHLIGALKDDHPNIRVSAAQALGAIGDASALPALEEALKDDTETKVNAPTTVSKATAEAIAQIKAGDGRKTNVQVGL